MSVDLQDSRDTSTPSSIIDPGDERESSLSEDEYFKPIKKLRMMPTALIPVTEAAIELIPQECEQSSQPSLAASPIMNNASPNGLSDKPLTSFLIKDILSSKPKHSHNNSCTNVNNSENSRGIIRPWDIETHTSVSHHNTLNTLSTLHHNRSQHIHSQHHNNHHNSLSHHHLSSYGRMAPNRRPRSADDDSHSEPSESDSPESPANNSVVGAITSPLDALFEMTSKAFDGIDGSEKSSDASADHLNLFSNRVSQAKKKRKSRTAFTNHQIFELEKRFLYQKYLSPADRDEIAQSLGLTNAQVITWFQNRRAKLKRDMEELKKDVDAAKIGSVHKSLLDNIQDLSLIKKSDLIAALHHTAHRKSP